MSRAADLKTRPISADEAAALFFAFETFSHILLAVSGGPDSIAMMVLARDWAKAKGRQAPKFSVATVDHGLRVEAQDEVRLVERAAKKLRMSHTTLKWDGVKPKSGLQEKARAARYNLLLAHARAIGAEAIAFAHHGEDQAETILLRLASGSGLTGLSGMKQMSMRDGIPILRPLLDLPSARLRSTLMMRNIPFVDDPSNVNDAFARVRMRKARDVLAAEGLTTERLQTLAHRLSRADDALRASAAAAECRHAMPVASGRCYASAVFDEPLEILVRLLQASIAEIGAGEEPAMQRLENHIFDLVTARRLGKSLKLTIGGTVLSVSTDGRLKIVAESPRRKVW